MEQRQQEQLQSLQRMVEQLQRQVEQLQQQFQQHAAEQQQQLVVSNNSNNEKKRPATLRTPLLSRTDAKKRIVDGKPATTSRMLQNSDPSIIVHICIFLDNDSLMNISAVSKKLRTIICDHPGMNNNRIAPVLTIGASDNANDAGRTQRLVNNLIRRVSSHANFFQRYRRIEVKNILKFDPLPFHELYDIEDRDQRFQLDGIQLDGIVSLDISCPSNGPSSESYPGLLDALSCMLPNLREIDMSNNGTDCYYCDSILNDVTTKHPRLEKITWNNIYLYALDLNMNTQHLKEIILDDATFYTLETVDAMSDLTYSPSIFLFCRSFGQVVERISIRNASWVDDECYGSPPPTSIPQNALIKFIRNAPPSLRWFRSDLTPENIDMLRLERPLIDFE